MANQINDADLENVVGGSIFFNEDHTMCGRNCDNQYKVLDFDKALSYAQKNVSNKPEKQVLQEMLDLKYIAYP